jgi:hypothetical protein
LKADKLLIPFKVDIGREGDKAKFAVRDTLVVDEAKLPSLAPEKVAAYLKCQVLAVIYAHLISLHSFLAVANRTGAPSADVSPWWAK